MAVREPLPLIENIMAFDGAQPARFTISCTIAEMSALRSATPLSPTVVQAAGDQLAEALVTGREDTSNLTFVNGVALSLACPRISSDAALLLVSSAVNWM